MRDREKAAVIIMFVILGGLFVIWIFGVIFNWAAMVERPVRVSYFLSDYTVVIPPGVIACIGLIKRKPWAKPLFLFTLGALLFDTAHQVYYLFWDNYFGVPLVFAGLLLALMVAYTVFAFKTIT